MKKYIEILRGIGFDDNSAKIYLALLENPMSIVSQITDFTGLHRMQVYRLLPNLIERGFIFVTVKGKRKLYSPVNPEKVEDEYKLLFKNKKRSISDLKEKFNNVDKKANIIFKKGRSGIKNVYNDLLYNLDKGGIYYRITSEVDPEKIKRYYQPSDYLEKRDKKEIERYIIYSENTAKLKKPKLEREEKVISGEIDSFDDNISFTIYSDKVSFIDFNSETSIIIESKEIAEFQKKIFGLLFKRL